MDNTSDTRLGVNFLVMRKAAHGVEFIMQKRDQKSRQYKGYWAIPGGGLKPEDNQDFASAATRECLGETRIMIQPSEWKPLCVRPDNNPGQVVWALVPSDTPTECHEGEAMEWKTMAEFEQLADNEKIGYEQAQWLLSHLKRIIDTQLEHTQEMRLKIS